MVPSDISQISHECNTWRDSLRKHKQEITDLNAELQEVAAHLYSKNALAQVEHFHNQFHIQLVNIHDLKQDIKLHDRKLSLVSDGKLDDQFLADHEQLFDKYQVLEQTLQELGADFKLFKQNISITA